MKALRNNKVIGLAIGERSLLAAEVLAGDRPQARNLAEFVYPEGVTPQTPEALGKALREFLRERGFTAKAAVVGLPARWLVVKPKEVPPADPSTLADLLRLQAEGEFSSELKDLVYDYAGNAETRSVTSVLIIATPRKYIEAAQQICQEAGLTAVAVMPSAIALGTATGRSLGKDSLVLAVGAGGSAELTAQSGGVASAIRHLRAPTADRPFVGDLRRALSSIPANGSIREMVMWDGSEANGSLNTDSMTENLGFTVRAGDLPVLGVDSSETHSNGHGRRYAQAVALALTGTGIVEPSVDFLHSRLAPKKQHRIPRWAIFAASAVLVLIVASIYAYTSLENQRATVDTLNGELQAEKDHIGSASAFVSMVSYAQAWHGGDPRYLACLRDLTNAVASDNVTYATNLILRDVKPQPTGVAATGKPIDPRTLDGVFTGKTSDPQRVQFVLDGIKRNPAFTNVALPDTHDAGRGREVLFSITFQYLPKAATH